MCPSNLHIIVSADHTAAFHCLKGQQAPHMGFISFFWKCYVLNEIY